MVGTDHCTLDRPETERGICLCNPGIGMSTCLPHPNSGQGICPLPHTDTENSCSSHHHRTQVSKDRSNCCKQEGSKGYTYDPSNAVSSYPQALACDGEPAVSLVVAPVLAAVAVFLPAGTWNEKVHNLFNTVSWHQRMLHADTCIYV